MNILILEDSGSVAINLADICSDLGHNVFRAFNILDAKSHWEEQKIDCIIADLNMARNGLSKEEKDKTFDGILTGWVWLKEHILPDSNMKNKIIIYSDYIAVLKTSGIDESEYAGILLIKKREDKAVLLLKNKIRSIAKNLDSNKS